MTLLQLKYISTVAKCGSFSKAAQVLYVSQPGISKMVCALEEELGDHDFCPLCRRDHPDRRGPGASEHGRTAFDGR